MRADLLEGASIQSEEQQSMPSSNSCGKSSAIASFLSCASLHHFVCFKYGADADKSVDDTSGRAITEHGGYEVVVESADEAPVYAANEQQ